VFQVNDLWAGLMTEKLGYERFGAHGGGWGSTITEQLARSNADAVAAIHLTDVPFGHIIRTREPFVSDHSVFDRVTQIHVARRSSAFIFRSQLWEILIKQAKTTYSSQRPSNPARLSN
jgi:hypothetical protein